MTKPVQKTEASIQISNTEEINVELKSQDIGATPASSSQNKEKTDFSSQNKFKKSNQTKSKNKSSKES